jgi:hypothetical protein
VRPYAKPVQVSVIDGTQIEGRKRPRLRKLLNQWWRGEKLESQRTLRTAAKAAEKINEELRGD